MALQPKREYSYKWTGRDKTGKTVNGVHRAPSPSEVRSLLLQQGIQVLDIRRTKEKSARGGKVKNSDIMLFARQMSTMMSAGIPISESLALQASTMKKLSMRELLQQIRISVDRGEGLTGALSRHPNVFSPMFRGLVESGERSGTLERVFEQLAHFMEKTESTKKAIKKALIYPVAVISIAVIITAIILVKVVPTFENLFASGGSELPAATQIVVNISDFIQSRSFVFSLLAIIVLIWALIEYSKKNEDFRYRLHGLIIKTPIVGQLSILSNSSIYARTLATMYDAGTPMITSLHTVANATNNLLFREAILKIKDQVSIGQELNFAMHQSQLFPDMITHMVSIGEKSGNLSQMLYRVSDVYDEDINNTVDGLMSLLEPFLIVFLGVLIGGIVVAMYLPLFNMGDVI